MDHPGRTDDDPARDSVDDLLSDWARERPDLDFAPVGIVTRLARLRGHLDVGVNHVFVRHDLSSADFVVVVSLRRAGAPYRLPQVALMHRLGLTSGTVSVRIDRLVDRGVVVREPAPEDRRVQLVRLTDTGLRLFDEIAPEHLANEDRLLSALDDDQRNELTALLRRVLTTFERPTCRLSALGVELLEAHAARARRVEVGLSDVAGLLVATPPVPGSAAAAAGLRHGDLLTAADGGALLSIASLSQLLEAARHEGRTVHVDLLRGEKRRVVSLRPRREP